MSDDLVSGLLAAIEQRERTARAAESGPWETLVVATPEDWLRLCRAHRKIIAMYQQAKARPVCREGREARLRGLDHASAMGRLTTLGLVLQALAEGFGLSEEDNE